MFWNRPHIDSAEYKKLQTIMLIQETDLSKLKLDMERLEKQFASLRGQFYQTKQEIKLVDPKDLSTEFSPGFLKTS